MRSFARKLNGTRRLLRLFGALSPVVLLTGCSRNDEVLLGRAIPVKPSLVLSGRPLSGRVFTIGVVPPPNAPEWYSWARGGMEGAAADNEVLLEQRPSAPAGGSPDRQVQRLLAGRVDALLVWTAADPNGAAHAVQAARAAHTPVFTLGTASNRGPATAHFVTTAPLVDLSPEEIGRTAVDRIAAYLRGEKLKSWIVIRPESNAAHKTK
jgi:ABC-type sugar transport system substrate-binding protein